MSTYRQYPMNGPTCNDRTCSSFACVYEPLEARQLMSVGGLVWTDMDANGLQDAGEPGVAGVTVNLFDAETGGALATTTTDALGSYQFGGVAAGGYWVEFVLPAGDLFTAQNAGTDPAIDSDANEITGETDNFGLESELDVVVMDAGVYQTAAVGDTVWQDMDVNGVQDAGEPGVAGVTVNLFEVENGEIIATTTTDAQGQYLFDGLTPGMYWVEFGLPDGMLFTTQNAGIDPTVDSDANEVTGETDYLALTSGQVDTSYDAGVYSLASVGDTVWEDVNGDGLQNAGEPGLAGVTVNLYEADNGEIIATTATDAQGQYLFDGVAPGGYWIEVVPLDGYSFTTQNAGTDTAIDSDVDQVAGQSDTFSLASGQADGTWDAGMYRPAVLGGVAWNDVNGNGIQDAGEPALEGVNVTLLDADGAPMASAATGADGSYLFTDVTPGSYAVGFEAPAGMAFSPADQGVDTLDSDVIPALGTTASIAVPSGGMSLSTAAGLLTPSSISGMAWQEVNGDGVRTADEGPMAGVTMELLDGNGNVVAQTQTAADGAYEFDNLGEGDYSVQVVTTEGLFIAPAGLGGDATMDSDFDPATGLAGPFTLAAGDQQTNIDAGLFTVGNISGMVWNDANADGIRTSNEASIDGVMVDLMDANGMVVASTETADGGTYVFLAVPVGQYSLAFTAPDGTVWSPQDMGANDDVDSDVAVDTGVTDLLGLSAVEDLVNVDAGAFVVSAPVTFGGPDRLKLVFVDADGTRVTMTMTNGTATATFLGDGVTETLDARHHTVTVTGTGLALQTIDLVDSTARSALTVTTRGGTALGATVGAVTGLLPMGRVDAPTVDLVLAGVTMADVGFIATLNLHNILNGADVMMNGIAAGPVSIKAGRVQGGTDISLGDTLRGGATLVLGRVADLNVTSTMPIASISATEWLDGDATADQVQAPSLGKLTVTRLLQHVQVNVEGVIGAVRLGAVADSNIFAGVNTGGPLPTDPGEFTPDGVIRAFSITGIRGLGASPMVNSNVAAWSLGTIALQNVQPINGGTTFGVSAGSIRSITLRQGAVVNTWRNVAGPSATPLFQTGDFAILLP